MKSSPIAAVGFVAATVFAFGGTVALAADAIPGPAYLVVEVNVKDQERFNEYAEKATATISQYGGTFLAMDGDPQAVEGPDPNGNAVIIKFNSLDDARNWLESPEYTAVKGIRHESADTRQYLVQGLPPEQSSSTRN